MAHADATFKTARLTPVAFVGPDSMFQSVFPPHVLQEFEALEGVSVLPSSGDVRSAVLAVTGWGSPRFDDVLLDEMPALRGIVHAAGSVRSVISDDIWRRGIEICNNADLNAKPVAEYTFSMIVSAAKGVIPASPRPPLGLYDLTIGIVGASRIGRATIRLLKALDVSILLYDPYIDDGAAIRLGVERVDLGTLLRASDIVSLHVPSLESTRHLIGASELARMKRGSTLINTARGAVVDTAALLQALEAGDIFAILDVTDPEPLPEQHPLRHLPNVTITPHIAGSMGRELWRLGRGVIESTRQFVRTGHLPDRITRDLLQVQA